MKKAIAFILTLAMVLALAACGRASNSNDLDSIPTIPQNEEPTDSNNAEIHIDSTTNTPKNPTAFDALTEIVLNDVEDTVSAINSEYEKLITDIDTYEKYHEDTDRVEAFYAKVLNDTKDLCIRMREYSIDFAESIMSSDKSNDEKYDDFDELYDCIYEDASDEIYDEIYDGILDDMYDDLYDGVLDDAYDNIPYSEWSDARSNEYGWWSDTRSDAYEEWSDFRSDVYEFWSDMRSELWGDDIERAYEKIEDFREDVEKLKSNDAQDSNENSQPTENNAAPTEVPENTISPTEPEGGNSSSDLVDGMRPEFKDAMDSYEAFYDEYCDLMQKYSENPSDLKLLAEYADMMTKAADMSEKFEDWEDDELNNAELKYYLDVNNRVMQKLLEVAG
jgi:hypothetical protein